jgi:hypothetical protein
LAVLEVVAVVAVQALAELLALDLVLAFQSEEFPLAESLSAVLEQEVLPRLQ